MLQTDFILSMVAWTIHAGLHLIPDSKYNIWDTSFADGLCFVCTTLQVCILCVLIYVTQTLNVLARGSLHWTQKKKLNLLTRTLIAATNIIWYTRDYIIYAHTPNLVHRTLTHNSIHSNLVAGDKSRRSLDLYWGQCGSLKSAEAELVGHADLGTRGLLVWLCLLLLRILFRDIRSAASSNCFWNEKKIHMQKK